MVSAARDEGEQRSPKRAVDRTIIVVEALAGIGVVIAIVGKTYGIAPTIFFVLCALAVAFSGTILVRMAGAWRDESLDATGKVRDTERERLEQEKHLLLQGIKELESDAAIGKVDARDYAYLRRTAEARAIEIIAQLRDDDARWMAEAQALVARRLGRPAPADVVSELPPALPPAAGGSSTPPAVDGDGEPADRRIFDDRPAAMLPREGAVPAALVCEPCSTQNELDARFCIGCGRPRATELAAGGGLRA